MVPRALPRGLSFWHPVCLISTWFGAGLLPMAPGTWGSLAALPFAWLVLDFLGPAALAAAGAALFLTGCWTAEVYARRTSETDPDSVVIDEVAGQFLVLAAAPLHVGWFLAGLVLFRLADILKPWPVSWADRRVPGGFGVMLDDALAAIYAGVLLNGLVLIAG